MFTTPTDTPLPAWVEPAARLPVAFAQVREDARVDLNVLARLGDRDLRVLMIASGGCTAAALAATGAVGHLHLVDVNPAQVALARLKLHLLRASGPSDRRAILGHAPLPAGERAPRLAAALSNLDLPAEALGPSAVVAEVGPDHAGRYERLFAEFRNELTPAADELTGLLRLRDPAEQARRAAADAPLGRALDEAFDRTMDLPILVCLFGSAATQNGREPFARHFARRTRHALATLPAADNPYLWQVLAGRYPEGSAAPWLDASAPARMPRVRTSTCPMDVALAAVDGPYDLVHLSNVLDWLTPDQASRTLDLARSALRPGGLAIVRQLNSTLEVPALGGQFDWLAADAAALHAGDRSYFYRSLHLGRRP